MESYNSLNCHDDILIEILSRVPADRLLVFKKVCPHWRVLISSYDFFKLHMKRAKRVMFVENYWGCSTKAFWLGDGRSETNLLNLEGIKKQCDDVQRIYIVGSCDGLLMFDILPGNRSLIINPVTQESRIIESPTEMGKLHTCCIFFDRFEDDYKLLQLFSTLGQGQIHRRFLRHYGIYSFKRDVWTIINSVETHHVFVPRLYDPPVLVGDALHWTRYSYYRCSKMVLVFKIQTKDFSFMPFPTGIKTKLYTKTNCCLSPEQDYLPYLNHEEALQLIEKDGMLCLCHIHNSVIDLWFLKCYRDWGSWARMFNIDLFQVEMRATLQMLKAASLIRIVSFNDDDMLIAWPYGRLYLYNLETNKIKLIEKFKLQNPSMHEIYKCIPVIKTLLSPRR